METKRVPKYNHNNGHSRIVTNPTRTRYSAVNCTCSAQRRTATWNIGKFALLRSSTIVHRDECDCADIIERRFFVTNLFLRHGVGGSLVSFRVNGRSSFLQDLSCTRIVDGANSPTFRLFSRCLDHYSTPQDQRKVLRGVDFDTQLVLDSLRHCFRMGEASPFDVNQYGQTLLNVLCLPPLE